MPTDAEGAGFVEQDRFQRGHIVGVAEDAQDHAGAILLHLNGGRVNVERPRRQQRPLGVADDFPRGIVEIGFEQHHAVRRSRGGP